MSSEGHGGRTRKDNDPAIDISRIRIGGDVAGLIFVVGTVVCLLAGVPVARTFFGLTLAAGTVLAVLIAWWHRRRG